MSEKKRGMGGPPPKKGIMEWYAMISFVGAPEGMEFHEKDFWGISSPSGSPVHTLERSWQSLGKGIIM